MNVFMNTNSVATVSEAVAMCRRARKQVRFYNSPSLLTMPNCREPRINWSNLAGDLFRKARFLQKSQPAESQGDGKALRTTAALRKP